MISLMTLELVPKFADLPLSCFIFIDIAYTLISLKVPTGIKRGFQSDVK